MQLKVQVASVFQDFGALDDDALGNHLVEMVVPRVPERRAPTVVTIARDDRLDVLGLKSVVENRLPMRTFIGSLTRASVDDGTVGHASAVGLMGTIEVAPRSGEARVPMAVVFLEWPDCRWWHWRALIEPTTRELRLDTVTLTRAVDGDPLPPGFGRWWSTGRLMKTSPHFAGWPARVEAAAPVVH